MGKTYMTNQINTSATICESAGADIADVRGSLVAYDSNGNVVLPAKKGAAVIGIGILTNSETIKAGETVDIQVKEMGLVKAGGEIAKGNELAADTSGLAVAAADGDFVIGTALTAGNSGQFVSIQIAKYYKPAAPSTP